MLRIQKRPEFVTKTFRLPKELMEKLDRIACINDISLNQIVIQCLTYAFNDIDTKDIEKTQGK